MPCEEKKTIGTVEFSTFSYLFLSKEQGFDRQVCEAVASLVIDRALVTLVIEKKDTIPRSVTCNSDMHTTRLELDISRIDTNYFISEKVWAIG